jgi:hypothetical protein
MATITSITLMCTGRAAVTITIDKKPHAARSAD